MKTILCHFFNEEYLLPWWLNHHKQFFDHGIMINYASTDNSVDIIKKICPTWEIINSRNTIFAGSLIDNEVYDIENAKVKDWRICLNVTEFLLGDYKSLLENQDRKKYLINCLTIVDTKEERESTDINFNLPLFNQFTHGLNINDSMLENGSRRLCNYTDKYTKGRHYKSITDNCPFIILKYKFAPMTSEFLKRKLQIQTKMPVGDPHLFRQGDYHTDFGRGLTKEKLIEIYKKYKTEDVSEIIDKFLKLTYN
jgi:hypothetical protein